MAEQDATPDRDHNPGTPGVVNDGSKPGPLWEEPPPLSEEDDQALTEIWAKVLAEREDEAERAEIMADILGGVAGTDEAAGALKD